MLSLLAALSMGLEPGSQSLLADAPVAAYPQVRLAQTQTGAPRSLAELHLELSDLQDAMPSTGAPIAAIISGGVLILGGLIAGYVGLILALVGGPGVVLIGGLIAGAAGVALLIVGIVVLSRTTRERRAIAKDIEAVRREIRAYEGPAYQPPLTPPRRQEAPLSPPPPPPQVEGPHASLLLAAF